MGRVAAHSQSRFCSNYEKLDKQELPEVLGQPIEVQPKSLHLRLSLQSALWLLASSINLQ